MHNLILPIAIAFMLAAPCTALAGEKNKEKYIEVQSFSWGQANLGTAGSGRIGGTVKQNYKPQKPDGPYGLTSKGTLGGSTGTTKPPLPTASTQHR